MSQPYMTHDMRRFSDLCTQLAAASGSTDLQRVVRSEAASVAKVAASLQPIASKEAIAATAAFRVLHSITNGASGGPKISVNGRAGRRGGERGTVWFRAKATGRGGKDWRRIGNWQPPLKFAASGRRLSSWDWAIAQSMWADAVQEAERAVKLALRARGLTAQSWVHMIEDLGFVPREVSPRGRSVPPFVRRARSGRKRKRLRTGFAAVEHSDRGTWVVLRNINRIAIRTGGSAKFTSAINIRKQAFLKAFKHGVFESIKGRTRMYPGLFNG